MQFFRRLITKFQKMRPAYVCVVVVLILLSFSFVVSVLSKSEHGVVSGLKHIENEKNSVIFNLRTALPDGGTYKETDDNFIVEGFKFYKKLPPIVKKITNKFRPKDTWLLHGKGAVGNITLRNIQREQSKLQSVLVLVKYYTNWNWAVNSEVTVTGSYYHRDSDHWEEEEEKLPDITAGEPKKSGFCEKIVYFGTVDDVKIEGRITNTNDALVMISEVKIVVGPSEFDKMEELVC